MALSQQQSIQLYGTEAYTGWGEAEASADANAHPEKLGMSGGGGVPIFNFDFEKAATEAYGELGSYYNRLLEWAKGDMNKVLSRMTEDYDRGLRFKKEDVATQEESIATSEADRKRAVINSLLSRGLFNKSAYDPTGGIGLGQSVLNEELSPFSKQRELIKRNLSRYEEESGIAQARTRADQTESLTRKEFDFEQRRRQEAAELANLRGDRAYQKFTTQLT